MHLISSYVKGYMLAANHVQLADLIWLIVVLFLIGALYLVFAVHNYIGAGVAVLLAVIVAIFFT